PFLGENLFTTKGEPREAIVAVSMLQQGNWILPVSFGADIPYKPPMLAWCVAALGWLNGGVVTEFLSRLPSALAAVVMLVCCFRLYARRTSLNLAAMMTLITATSVEVFRSSTICRVDMLLTMFVVTAMFAYFRQWEKHPEGTWRPSVVAALLMTGGVLTKGPVGMLLPSMVIWVFRLMRGNRFWPTTFSVGIAALMSLAVPLLWYYAAWLQGGDEFLRLAMEENFGRFTGTMSYESHENGVWYNFVSQAWGFAPYSLLLLLSLFVLPWKSVSWRSAAKGWWKRVRQMDPIELFSLLAAVLVFVFYCIPKSKRSVYLLPVYPFMAYFTALYVRWLARGGKWCVKAYCWTICVVGFLAAVAVWLLAGGMIPVSGNAALECISGEMGTYAYRLWPAVLWFLVIGAALLLAKRLLSGRADDCFGRTVVYTMFLYWLVQATVLPAAMNYKSEKPIAGEISRIAGHDTEVYSFKGQRLARFYTVNYYLDDKVRLFDGCRADEGYVIVNRRDEDLFRESAGDYSLEELRLPVQRGIKERNRIVLYRFRKNQVNS
nr:glycosyltransferase family 39 protein [Muribaculaceae bacterium]